MSIAPLPKAGDVMRGIIRSAIAGGTFTATNSSEITSALRAMGRGFLRRDSNDTYTFSATKTGITFLARADAAPVSPAAPITNAGRIAIRRPIASIDARSRLRPVDPERVAVLKVSIGELGLRTPISVLGTPEDDTVPLSAGAHRLEAMRELGETHIDCFHETGDDLDREIWEIDENLCRAELTAADRALFIFRRKEIYLMRHPETAQHVSGGKARQNAASDKLSFAESTAQATGQDRRTIERDAARGSRIVEQALHRLRGTRLNNGKFLDRLKQVPAEQQVLYVDAALQEEKRKAADVKENRRQLSEHRHGVRLAHMAMVSDAGARTAGAVNRKYPIIYADPPWQFGVHSEVTGREKSAENHYPTMPTEKIHALFSEIGDPATADAVCFLWATNPMLPEGIDTLKAWGFKYVHHWIWDKEVAGTGYWGRDRHELLLIGRRGKPATPLQGTQPETVYREQKTAHSVKPEWFAEQIERLYPGVPKLEMFCRSARPGWDVWGFEAGAAVESEVA